MSWICCAGSLGVAALFATGRVRAGLWCSLVMQAPWALMAWQAGQWGAVVCAAAFVLIDVWGLCRARGAVRA